MSKYTTEVRFICEHEAGYDESKGANDVDTILTNSWNKIFTTNCTFFDNTYRSILCKKILKHYYLREIGAEVVGIWKLWMNTKLEEIMPYYNQLYTSALLEFDPFKDVDYTKEHSGSSDGSKSVEGETNTQESSSSQNDKSGSGSTTGNSSVNNTGAKTTDGAYTDEGTVGDARDISTNGSWSSTGSKSDRYSDTPQGTIANTDVEGNAYLTNVRLIGESASGSNGDTTFDNNLQTKNLLGTNTSAESYSDDTDSTRNENNVYEETNAVDSSSTGNVTNNVNESMINSDQYLDHIVGKMSTMPYSDLLQKYRETFLNIDMMVIEEFDELFLGLW